MVDYRHLHRILKGFQNSFCNITFLHQVKLIITVYTIYLIPPTKYVASLFGAVTERRAL